MARTPPRRSLPAPAATPMAFVRALVRGYERYGEDPGEALRAAQITPAQLASSSARITARQMEVVSEAAMRQLDDEALGWFSRKLPWGSYGMLCRASITAPTLGVALKRWCRHHRLLTDDVLLQLSHAGAEATLSIAERRRFGDLREFCLLTLLRYVHGYACWAVDSRIPLLRVTFPFAAPPHADVYPLLFPGPVAFDAGPASLSFDAQYLALPLQRDEHALQLMLQRALPLTVLPYRRDRLLVRRVRQALRSRADRLRSAADLARELHVSVRSLHRQIREEGSSLQALKDAARRELAVELLDRSGRSVKQVAWAVGFRSEKSFSRAFRQWTGRSPVAHRRRGAAP
ncbi:AraC family transcriptional regulator [Anaeromyxobacter diazotrophicus]|uniref:Transcriptional regulator n=1 Tax=Anaeromyxobacter diazotrophicus TaxID=2590199 RepID=A0A7I9VI11_9BACT|nr:AraC family transcriptional regulator [Anaeromyxobacter diazotrophicus]GEJ55985.1 transcriptional regulator [Anaeromyxobacter diazotrophicus]